MKTSCCLFYKINISDFSRIFYIAFILATGTVYGQRNVTTQEFITRAVENGISEELAIQSVKDICHKLEYGTREEKYVAASQLAAIYSYVLLPIEDQL